MPSFRYTNKTVSIFPNGAQIFGSKEPDVSDLFYSTFQNDSRYLTTDLSLYNIFQQNTPVTLVPEWPVSRLLLTKGEIAGYIQRYYEYREQRAAAKSPIVSVSSPTFMRMYENFDLETPWNRAQEDDLGFFIGELHKRFGVLDAEDYRLYGIKDGAVQTGPSAKDMTVESLQMENRQGMMELVFNGHGSPKAFFKTVTPPGAKGQSDQTPFLTADNINDILIQNYYTLYVASCENAYQLNGDNIIHTALSEGKLINPISGASSLSNNGVFNYREEWDEAADAWKYVPVTYEDLKLNNPFFLSYPYFKGVKEGKTRLQSFHDAKKLYAEEIMKHRDEEQGFLYSRNYEFNLMNVLSLHYLGLAEY